MEARAAALDFSSSLARFQRRRDVLDALHLAAADISDGLKLLAVWRLPRRPANFARGYILGHNVFLHTSLPRDYWRDFLREARKNGPSVLANLAWANSGPFTITEAMKLMAPLGADRWIFRHCRKFGIRDGLYCPAGRWIVVYWSERVLQLSSEQRYLLNFIAFTAAARLSEMHSAKPATHRRGPALSARELTVLRHLSHGATDEHVGKLLEISVATVRTYVTRAKKKLNAKTSRHAVAEALRMRLIT